MGAARMEIGPAVVVATSEPDETRWGYYQFPFLWREPDGRLAVSVQVRPDDDRWLHEPSPAWVSDDGGAHWSPAPRVMRPSFLTLSSGDQISRDAAVFPLAEVELPPPAGAFHNTYGLDSTLYRWSELKPDLAARCFPLYRRRSGSAEWEPIPTTVEDAGVLCEALDSGIFVPFGDWCSEFHEAPDGALLYLGYRVRLTDAGAPDRYMGPWLLRSTDAGRSWRFHGCIRYEPALAGPDRLGLTEPTMALTGGGRSVCAMRTTDGIGPGPLVQSESADLGRSWTQPHAIADHGVRPRLLRLDCGVLALSCGRPDVCLRLSADAGRSWGEPAVLVEPAPGDLAGATCGYTDLLADGPDRFLIAYTDFRHRDSRGRRRKAVVVRRVQTFVSRPDGTAMRNLAARWENRDDALCRERGILPDQGP